MRIWNFVIIGAIFLILYATVGFRFVDFYFGGKNAILTAGESINKLCNDNAACPTTISGWQKESEGMLRKDGMLYFVSSSKNTETKKNNTESQTFRIVYTMPIPDDWFEVQGGVGKKVTSGWKSR